MPQRVSTAAGAAATPYIPPWEGWLYLATVIDLGPRQVVGWATTDHRRTGLVEQALCHAITQCRTEPGVIFTPTG